MNADVGTINDYLVRIFNDILTIEEAELQKSKFADISIKEMHTIEAIGMNRNKTSSEVAKELMITVGTLTVAINNLEKKDYVARIRSESDRRVVKLGLTKKGKLVFRVHQAFHRTMVQNILGDMNEFEANSLLKALVNLHAYLGQLKGAAKN